MHQLAVCRNSSEQPQHAVLPDETHPCTTLRQAETRIGHHLPILLPDMRNHIIQQKIRTGKELSKCFLKSSNSAEIGILMRDILSIHHYLSTKIVIKQLIRYFLYFYHEKINIWIQLDKLFFLTLMHWYTVLIMHLSKPANQLQRIQHFCHFGFVNTLEEVLKKRKSHAHIGSFRSFRTNIPPRGFEQYKAQREETPKRSVFRTYYKDIIRAYRILFWKCPDMKPTMW